jgi:hypothetical protein
MLIVGRSIKVKVGDDNATFLITVPDVLQAVNLNQTIQTILSELHLMKGIKRARDTVDPYDHYELFNHDQEFVGSAASLVNDQTYYFKAPTALNILSASNWTEGELAALKVQFEIVSSLPSFSTAVVRSEKAVELIEELVELNDRSYIPDYKNLERPDIRLKNLFYKAVYIVQKYHNHESAVDIFVQLLLYRLGYFDDWLYVFPQLRLKLRYGQGLETQNKCLAVADFTAMDVVSNLRMAVVEDKRLVDSQIINSEPQLIAELIALYQAHDFTVEEIGASTATASVTVRPPVVGVRVNGLHFWFYQIDDPQHLLNAMTTKLAANEWTTVSKLGGPLGLSFLKPDERTTIIHTLDDICSLFKVEGLHSVRRNSNAPH